MEQSRQAGTFEQLFELFVNAYPYRNLSKAEFETLIKMLAEGYSTRRGRRGAISIWISSEGCIPDASQSRIPD